MSNDTPIILNAIKNNKPVVMSPFDEKIPLIAKYTIESVEDQAVLPINTTNSGYLMHKMLGDNGSVSGVSGNFTSITDVINNNFKNYTHSGCYGGFHDTDKDLFFVLNPSSATRQQLQVLKPDGTNLISAGANLTIENAFTSNVINRGVGIWKKNKFYIVENDIRLVANAKLNLKFGEYAIGGTTQSPTLVKVGTYDLGISGTFPNNAPSFTNTAVQYGTPQVDSKYIIFNTLANYEIVDGSKNVYCFFDTESKTVVSNVIIEPKGDEKYGALNCEGIFYKNHYYYTYAERIDRVYYVYVAKYDFINDVVVKIQTYLINATLTKITSYLQNHLLLDAYGGGKFFIDMNTLDIVSVTYNGGALGSTIASPYKAGIISSDVTGTDIKTNTRYKYRVELEGYEFY